MEMVAVPITAQPCGRPLCSAHIEKVYFQPSRLTAQPDLPDAGMAEGKGHASFPYRNQLIIRSYCYCDLLQSRKLGIRV